MSETAQMVSLDGLSKGFGSEDTRVEVPDRVIGRLLVVRARRQSAVALIRHTETELELGDRFRGALE